MLKLNGFKKNVINILVNV